MMAAGTPNEDNWEVVGALGSRHTECENECIELGIANLYREGCITGLYAGWRGWR